MYVSWEAEKFKTQILSEILLKNLIGRYSNRRESAAYSAKEHQKGK